MLMLQLWGMGREKALGPAPSFRIAGNELWISDRPVARYDGNFWVVDDQNFTSIIISSPALVRSENDGSPPRDFGVFEQVKISDGMILAGPGGEKVFARFVAPVQLWHITVDGTFWSDLIMHAEAPATAPEEQAQPPVA